MDLKERTDESLLSECYFLKLKIYSLTWFFNSNYSTLYRAVIPVRYILLNSINSLCEFKKNYLYSSCTIYDYCYGIAQPNSKQDWKFHACSSCKELWKVVDNKYYLAFWNKWKASHWSMPTKRVTNDETKRYLVDTWAELWGEVK